MDKKLMECIGRIEKIRELVDKPTGYYFELKYQVEELEKELKNMVK